MCHAARSHPCAHETTTQNYELQCQHYACGSAIDHSYLISPCSLSCTDLFWANPSYLLTQPSQPNLNTHKNKLQAVTIEVAQMQFNYSPTFAPRGHQERNILAHLTEGSLSEDQDVASRTTLTPRLSYTSTPDSPYSTSNHAQRYGHNTSTGFDTTNGARDFMDGTEKAMLAQRSEVRSCSNNALKREFNVFPTVDWLSENSQNNDWPESPSIQATHSPQLTMLSIDPSFGHSAYSPHPALSSDTSLMSPNQVYAQHSSGMQQQTLVGTFGSSNSNHLSMLPHTSIEANDPFHVDNQSFPMGFGHLNYNAHAHPYQGDFNFNTSPSYSTLQYATEYSPYGIPQASGTLPTQIDTTQFTGRQPSKSRGNLKASELDELLLKWRAQDVTYKEIMKRGDWGLSESTLRGRYRTLTKDKRLRPRKPVWDNAAVRINTSFFLLQWLYLLFNSSQHWSQQSIFSHHRHQPQLEQLTLEARFRGRR